MIRKRLMDENRIKAQEAALDRMLVTLFHAGYVTLSPEPTAAIQQNVNPVVEAAPTKGELLLKALGISEQPAAVDAAPGEGRDADGEARSTARLPQRASALRHSFCSISASPIAPDEFAPWKACWRCRGSVLRYCVYRETISRPGPLALTRLDADLISRGLMIAKPPPVEGEEEDDEWTPWREEEERPPTLSDKLRLLFDALYPEVNDVTTQSIWAAGELLRFGGNFNKFVPSRDLVKQEGILFRHLLRLILLCGEFQQVTPVDMDPLAWQAELRDIAEQLTASCREIDPTSTDEAMAQAHAADVVEGENVLPPGNERLRLRRPVKRAAARDQRIAAKACSFWQTRCSV